MLGFIIFGIILIILAILYIVSPVDLIPEAILKKIGYLDDYLIGGSIMIIGTVFLIIGLMEFLSATTLFLIFLFAIIVYLMLLAIKQLA